MATKQGIVESGWWIVVSSQGLRPQMADVASGAQRGLAAICGPYAVISSTLDRESAGEGEEINA